MGLTSFLYKTSPQQVHNLKPYDIQNSLRNRSKGDQLIVWKRYGKFLLWVRWIAFATLWHERETLPGSQANNR